LKDYCPIFIVKEEVDRECKSGALAQEVYSSLYLNNTLKLYLNTIYNIYNIYNIYGQTKVIVFF
jgi:hypothetical protein